MFGKEASVFLTKMPSLSNKILIPGASPGFTYASCNPEGTICQFTTGEAEINGALERERYATTTKLLS